jgi:hypothetical protein
MNNIEVLIAYKAYRKLRIWTDLAKGEVSGLGTVEEVRDKSGTLTSYLITDLDLIKQTSTSVETALDENAVNEYLYRLVTEGKDPSKVKLWWHSHGNIDVFWSNTDSENIERLCNSGYFISLLTNKAEKLLCRIDVYKPFHITLDNVDVNLNLFEEDELLDQCEGEFKSKVSEPKEMTASPVRTLEPLFPDDMLEPWDYSGRYLEEMERL